MDGMSRVNIGGYIVGKCIMYVHTYTCTCKLTMYMYTDAYT